MSVTLVVIFNHKFNKNIPVLRKLYKHRFSSIVFLVPFYQGKEDDVVSIYESSYQFQGYIAQALTRLKQEKNSHYVFVGDDLILNPSINENNILDILGMNQGDAYIESLTSLKDTSYWCYSRFQDAAQVFKSNAVNFYNEIPAIDEAVIKAKQFGITDYEINRRVKCEPYGIKRVRGNLNVIYQRILYPIRIKYPLVTGYSDFFVLPFEKITEFAHISGVFSSMRLFVEIAIPTTLMLIMSPNNLKMQKDSKMKTPKLWWITDTATNFEKNCNYIIQNMESNWPQDYLYLHPIKLSKWRMGEL